MPFVDMGGSPTLAGGALLQVGICDNCLGGVVEQGAFAEQHPGARVSFSLYIRAGGVVHGLDRQSNRGWFARLTDRTTARSPMARAPDYRGGWSAE